MPTSPSSNGIACLISKYVIERGRFERRTLRVGSSYSCLASGGDGGRQSRSPSYSAVRLWWSIISAIVGTGSMYSPFSPQFQDVLPGSRRGSLSWICEHVSRKEGTSLKPREEAVYLNDGEMSIRASILVKKDIETDIR